MFKKLKCGLKKWQMGISNLLAVAGLMQSDLGKHFISHFMKNEGTVSDFFWLSNFLTNRGESISTIVDMLEENGPVLPTSKRQFEKNTSSALKDEVYQYLIIYIKQNPKVRFVYSTGYDWYLSDTLIYENPIKNDAIKKERKLILKKRY